MHLVCLYYANYLLYCNFVKYVPFLPIWKLCLRDLRIFVHLPRRSRNLTESEWVAKHLKVTAITLLPAEMSSRINMLWVRHWRFAEQYYLVCVVCRWEAFCAPWKCTTCALVCICIFVFFYIICIWLYAYVYFSLGNMLECFKMVLRSGGCSCRTEISQHVDLGFNWGAIKREWGLCV